MAAASCTIGGGHKLKNHDQARHGCEIAVGLESEPAVRRYLEQLCSELPK
jgi:hypothetical protein